MAVTAGLAPADETAAVMLVVRFHREVRDFVRVTGLLFGVRRRLGGLLMFMGMFVLACPGGAVPKVEKQAQ